MMSMNWLQRYLRFISCEHTRPSGGKCQKCGEDLPMRGGYQPRALPPGTKLVPPQGGSGTAIWSPKDGD